MTIFSKKLLVLLAAERPSLAALRLLALTLALVLAGVEAGAKDRARSKAAQANEAELRCAVTGSFPKLITLTNTTERVIARGTKINFDGAGFLTSYRTLRTNLEPGEIAVVYVGAFPDIGCRCRISQ